ncbi:MAG: hypothetical protein ACLFRX_03105 [Gemmatimonadota bacterium]
MPDLLVGACPRGGEDASVLRSGPAVVILRYADAPRQVAWRRDRGRARPVPRHSFAQMGLAFEAPATDEGFSAVLRVEGGAGGGG